jgi:hypothetical protein
VETKVIESMTRGLSEQELAQFEVVAKKIARNLS